MTINCFSWLSLSQLLEMLVCDAFVIFSSLNMSVSLTMHDFINRGLPRRRKGDLNMPNEKHCWCIHHADGGFCHHVLGETCLGCCHDHANTDSCGCSSIRYIFWVLRENTVIWPWFNRWFSLARQCCSFVLLLVERMLLWLLHLCLHLWLSMLWPFDCSFVCSAHQISCLCDWLHKKGVAPFSVNLHSWHWCFS